MLYEYVVTCLIYKLSFDDTWKLLFWFLSALIQDKETNLDTYTFYVIVICHRALSCHFPAAKSLNKGLLYTFDETLPFYSRASDKKREEKGLASDAQLQRVNKIFPA